MNACINELDARQINQSSKLTYVKYLKKFFLNVPDPDAITTESVKKYVETHYDQKCRNTRRLITIILNTYVLKPRNLDPIRVPSKDLSRRTKTNNYSSEDVQKLLHEAIYGYSDDLGMYHCISFAVRTGLRIHEIIDLKVRDFLDGCEKSPLEILVRRGKGDKKRIVVISESDKGYFLNELKPYVLTLKTENVFPTCYANWLRRLKKIQRNAGLLEKKKAFHGMRSYFCTSKYQAMNDNNVAFPYFVLAQQLGHSNVSSVRNYIRPTIDQVRNFAMRT